MLIDVGGYRLHLCSAGEGSGPTVVLAPTEGELRFPFWALDRGPSRLTELDPDLVAAMADPTGTPQGWAYLPGSGSWEQFNPNMTPMTWEKVIFPSWLVQPWNPHSGYPIGYWADNGAIGHPDAGTPYLFYRVPPDAEVRSLTWSPGGLSFAVVERQDSGLVGHVLRAFQDYQGQQFSLPMKNEHVALSDDGATTFTVSGSTVTARNHLTGAETAWDAAGPVQALRLGRSVLLIVKADGVTVVPYRQAMQ